jgi:hypothetical protein
MSASPRFIGRPNSWIGQVSVANVNRDGVTGTYVTLMSGNASAVAPLEGIGSRVDLIRIMGVGTITAGMIRFFLSNGVNVRLIREEPVTTTTPSGTVAGFQQEINFPDGLIVPNGWSLLVSTHNAEVFNLHAQGGDF